MPYFLSHSESAFWILFFISVMVGGFFALTDDSETHKYPRDCVPMVSDRFGGMDC